MCQSKRSLKHVSLMSRLISWFSNNSDTSYNFFSILSLYKRNIQHQFGQHRPYFLGFDHITLGSKRLSFWCIFSFAFLVGVLANHHDCSFFLFKRNLILIINQQINHLMQIIFELVFTMNYENIFGNNCMTAKSSLEKASKACILTSQVVLLDQKSSKHAV